MAKKRSRTSSGSTRAASRTSDGPAALKFTMVNAGLAGAGFLTLGLGYWLLAQGSITAAPLLLVLAYVVLLPLAIIL